MSQVMMPQFQSWTERRLGAADLETTGVDVGTARIVTACVLSIDDGNKVNAANWLLNPGIEIPEEAAKIHGITTERARREGEDYEEGVLAIWAALQLLWSDGVMIAGFNFSYDATVLVCELNRLGHKVTRDDVGPIFDGFVVDKHYSHRKGKRKLTNVVEHYGVTIGDAHNADADALAAARLAWKMPRVYDELSRMTVAQLQEAQTKWYRQQAESLAAYFDRIGKEYDHIATSWPIQEAA